jgi:hypothetical protein
MDRPILIIEAPELSDDAIASVQCFLHEMMTAFESHYYRQLQQRARRLSCSHVVDDLNDDQNPF